MIFSCVFSNSKKMYLCAVVRTEARGADASKRRAYADGFAGGRQTYKKALSQRLICGVSNLASSISCCTVRQCSMSIGLYIPGMGMVCRVRTRRGESLFALTKRITHISVPYIQQRGLRHCLSSAGRQCESLIRGMSDGSDSRAFFMWICVTSDCQQLRHRESAGHCLCP